MMNYCEFPEIYTLPSNLLRFYDTVDAGLKEVLPLAHVRIGQPRPREKDQKHPIIQAFYKAFNAPPKGDHMSHIQRQYVRIVRHVAHEVGFRGATFYQSTPAIRVQRPGDLAVGEWHTDAQYGHQPEEVNVFMPLWSTNEQNTLWIEWQGKRKAYTVNRGQVLVFMGSKWWHGNRINDSAIGRVSFDFRLLSESDYRKGGKSINGAKTFELGSYWQEVYI